MQVFRFHSPGVIKLVKAGHGESRVFVHARRITFADTDAAKIAYTGRFPHFALDAIDAWFFERLATDWYRLNNELGFGTPFVKLAMAFRSPLVPPDMLATEVRLARAGRSSLTFAVLGRVGERVSFEGEFVCVFVDTRTGKPISIPPMFAEAVAREVALAAG